MLPEHAPWRALYHAVITYAFDLNEVQLAMHVAEFLTKGKQVFSRILLKNNHRLLVLHVACYVLSGLSCHRISICRPYKVN